MAFFFAFSLSFLSSERRRMARRFHPTPSEMNVKRSLKPTAEPTKNQKNLKTHNNQTHEPLNLKKD
jgi:hypothetical protein